MKRKKKRMNFVKFDRNEMREVNGNNKYSDSGDNITSEIIIEKPLPFDLE